MATRYYRSVVDDGTTNSWVTVSGPNMEATSDYLEGSGLWRRATRRERFRWEITRQRWSIFDLAAILGVAAILQAVLRYFG